MANETSNAREQSESRRERSLIDFPYLPLEDAVEIAKTIHTAFGTSCQREQLAAQLQQSPTGGGFNLRLGTAKMFGLITYDRGTVTLTELGMRVSDSQQEKAARADAFLNVPLYRALFEKYKGKALPSTSAGLEAEINTLGVAPKQKERARQVFQRSAKESGFFWAGTDRLVLPVTGRSGQSAPSEKPPAGEGREEPPPPPPPAHSHFIQGLLNSLPPERSEWSRKDRMKWLQLAAMAFEMMYTDADTTTNSIKVEIEGGSSTSTKS